MNRALNDVYDWSCRDFILFFSFALLRWALFPTFQLESELHTGCICLILAILADATFSWPTLFRISRFRGNNNTNTIFICRMRYVLFATFLPKNKAQSCIAPTKVRYWRACFMVWQCTRNSAVVSHVLAARRFHLHGVASRNCLLPTGELTRVNSFA